jgi:hypothetical protein
MKSLLTHSLLLFALSQTSGCFYWVEAGKGGAAELTQIKQRYIADEFPEFYPRLDQCYALIQAQTLSGIRAQMPAAYLEIENQLILSQRLYVARYFGEVEAPLSAAEQQLALLPTLVQESEPVTVCDANSEQEACK